MMVTLKRAEKGDKMARYLTETQFHERISAFESFLQSYQLVFLRIPRERNNVLPYIVSNRVELAKVSFSPLGSIFLIAADGKLKALLVHIQMIPQDSPLIELAELLGYTVYLISTPPLQEPSGPRYRVASEQEVACEGTNLAEVLASLIKHRPR